MSNTMLYYPDTASSNYYVVDFVEIIRCPLSGQKMARAQFPGGELIDIYKEQWGVHYANPNFNPFTGKESQC